MNGSLPGSSSFDVLAALARAFASPDTLAVGIAGALRAHHCVVQALSGDAGMVSAFPQSATSLDLDIALIGPGDTAPYVVPLQGPSEDLAIRELRAAGIASAVEFAVPGTDHPLGRVLVGSPDPAWHIPAEAASAAALMFQGLAPLFAERAAGHHKSIQRQLIQAQKMESLGSMAGHVAHDFNNLLTTILGYTNLLRVSPTISARDRESLNLVEEAAHRAADLSGRLLSFARGGLVRFGPLDLRSVVWDSLKLAEPTIHHSITLTVRLPEAAIPVEGHEGQLQQAILNIVLNAVDAMPEGGSIDVRLESDEAGAILTIADDGPGMEDEVRERVFEPFFTTKPVGSGSGLGMAITYGIVQGHDGRIDLETAPGRGASFTITLPLAEHHAPIGPFADPTVDGDLVLIVDDDDMVRRATGETVAHLGYNVVEASTGRVAIDLVKSRPDRFSVVLLDLVMPELTGAETFRELQKIREDLPVIVCTGYAADGHIDAPMKRKIAGLVQKPFSPERLKQAIEGIRLEGRGSGVEGRG
jgi:signal transduction histidine kinase/CheY-like chemotaxis protein